MMAFAITKQKHKPANSKMTLDRSPAHLLVPNSSQPIPLGGQEIQATLHQRKPTNRTIASLGGKRVTQPMADKADTRWVWNWEWMVGIGHSHAETSGGEATTKNRQGTISVSKGLSVEKQSDPTGYGIDAVDRGTFFNRYISVQFVSIPSVPFGDRPRHP